jgi:hypothetical protein
MEYENTGWLQDCSVIGGYVYRGQRDPTMQGIYFYGDYCSGRIWGLRAVGSTWETGELLRSPANITSFGEDENGNLYLASPDGGLYRLTTRKLLFLPGIYQAHLTQLPPPVGRQSSVPRHSQNIRSPERNE